MLTTKIFTCLPPLRLVPIFKVVYPFNWEADEREPKLFAGASGSDRRGREPGYEGSTGHLLPHVAGVGHFWINDSNSAFTHHLQQTIASTMAQVSSSMPMPNRSG